MDKKRISKVIPVMQVSLYLIYQVWSWIINVVNVRAWWHYIWYAPGVRCITPSTTRAVGYFYLWLVRLHSDHFRSSEQWSGQEGIMFTFSCCPLPCPILNFYTKHANITLLRNCIVLEWQNERWESEIVKYVWGHLFWIRFLAILEARRYSILYLRIYCILY